jgi:Ca2+-transporting ATPase
MSDTTEAETSPRPDEELRHVKSNTTSVTHVGSRSASRAKRDTADSDTATALSEKRKKGAEAQEHVELETNADPTPFRFRANDLAMMLDPKDLDSLEDIGGIDGLLDGLGTIIELGLGGASLERSTTGLSGRGDGRPGVGEGVSHRHDPEKGDETISLTDPEGGKKSTSWNSTAAFAASLDVRRRTYGENVLPHRATKSLLSLMYTALKDKVLVRQLFLPHIWKPKYEYSDQVLLSIAAVISLALGLFQDFGTTRPAGEPPVDWVEGVAIMVAIFIVVSAPS